MNRHNHLSFLCFMKSILDKPEKHKKYNVNPERSLCPNTKIFVSNFYFVLIRIEISEQGSEQIIDQDKLRYTHYETVVTNFS